MHNYNTVDPHPVPWYLPNVLYNKPKAKPRMEMRYAGRTRHCYRVINPLHPPTSRGSAWANIPNFDKFHFTSQLSCQHPLTYQTP